MSENRLDPVTLEILYNALRSATDESFIALMRSAYSTNIKLDLTQAAYFIF